MSVIGTIATTIKHGTGEDATLETIVCAMYKCKLTNITMPYRLVNRLASDDEFVKQLACSIVDGKTIDLNGMLAEDAAINLDTDYLLARERETPDLVRYDKNGRIRPRTTTPAAFVRRFIVPAIESYLDLEIILSLGIDVESMTPEHVNTLIKSVAHTTVSDKVRHHTDGVSSADKSAHLSRRARAKAARK